MLVRVSNSNGVNSNINANDANNTILMFQTPTE